MKNKFTRFLCFFLCFALCFAWLGPPQQVHATGIVPLLGVVIMFMIGTGIGIGINGTAHGLADGIEELVKEFETNYPVYQDKFWEFLASGLTIGPTGALLLNKDSTNLLNGFLGWLQSDKGWTEGETVEFSEVSCAYNPNRDWKINGVSSPIFLTGNIVDGNFALLDLITVAGTGNRYYNIPVNSIGTVLYTGDVLSPCSPNDRTATVVSPYILSIDDYQYDYSAALESFGFSVDDAIGFVFGQPLKYAPSSKYYYYIYFGVLTTSGTMVIIPQKSSEYNGSYPPQVDYCTSEYKLTDSYYFSVSNSVGSSVNIPDSLNLPDTAQWDDSVNLGLFAGHSGKFPESVQEFNDSVLNDLNSGVVPEVSTDVIVGTPDQVLPDEGDGTLSGTVSGILEYVKALPESIANSILTGVESIFIPDPDGVQAAYMAFLEEVNDYYSFDFDLGSLFGDAVAPDDITAVYAIGPLSWDLTFVSWYYLKSGVAYFRPYIRGFIVLMLIYYNLRQFMAIFGLGGVMNGSSGDSQSEAYVGRLMADYMSNYKG